jgi:filamentous hemagglutinin family protein
LFAQTPTSWANPTGGQVVSGTATINSPAPGTLTINQATSTAIINWQDFSIAAGELTRFQVPTSASATLNRVTGGNVSSIYGTLQSNGQLYLINPNGIVVGSSGQINTAGFVGSTLNFSDSQFNAQGDLNFSGSSNAGVNNQGTIHASTGDVYLIATQVTNGGTITAPEGNVGLAAGSQVLLQKAGDQHLFVQAGSNATSQATGVTNTGAIQSAAAELRAAGGNAYALAINNSGNIAATGITTINGQVYLTADGGNLTNSGAISATQANGNGGTIVLNAHSTTGATKGTLLHSGTITAAGTAQGTTGGTVELLGDRVGVTGSGVVNVSGDAGGGTALIGGDEHGANAAVPDASNTYLGPDAQVIADALRTGDGGKVILWGNESTQVYGSISVRGGPEGGNGGFVETSGASLQTTTIPDRSAPEGTPGTWLLDPTNITITDTGNTTSGFTNPFNVTAGPYTLNQADLLVALQGGGVTLDASGGSGGSGNITWQQPSTNTFDITSLTNAPTLELDAPGVLTLSSIKIKSVGGTGSLNLLFNANSSNAGTVAVTSSTVQLNGGDLNANGTSINVSGTVSGFDVNLNSPSITLSGATVTTTDPGVPMFNQGLILGDNFGGTGQISITNSTITGSSMLIGYYYNSGNLPTSQVNINDSAINLVLGSNPSSSNLYLQIAGASATAGSAGVTITNGSSITATGGASGDDNINIEGTGLVAAGSNAIGVLINGSTVTNGSSGTPGDVDIQIQGDSDAENSAAAPATFGAASALGVGIINGSTITSYSTESLGIHGTAYADDADQAAGTVIDSSAVNIINGHTHITGSVEAETLTGGTKIGAAYTVVGLEINAATLTTSGVSSAKNSGISLDADVKDSVVATDNGNSSIAPSDYGVNITGGSQITASGNTQVLYVPIDILASAGPAQSSSSQVATSVGIAVSGGSTITNSGLGAIVMDGASGPSSVNTTGTNVVADGVELTGTSGTPGVITATGGGSIAIAGLGGAVGSGSGGFARGIDLQSADITTNSGVIALMAGAGSGGSTVDLTGLELNSSSLQTGTTGGTAITNGGTVPPLIMIYATDSTGVLNPTSGVLEFQAGSATGYAIKEDSNSSVKTQNLVMGNYEDLFTAYAPSADSAKATTAEFNTFLANANVATFVGSHTINPTGIIDLGSTLNQVTHLDSVLVGSGGLDFYDSVSLTVDPIGTNNNTDYGQIDGPAQGPVTIIVAPNQNLTLTNVSPLTSTVNAQPVIATSGTGNTITLVTSGTGVFTNAAGSSALSVASGATYVIYATSSSQVVLDGISPAQTLNSTVYPGAAGASVNTIAYASGTTDILSGTDYSDNGGMIIAPTGTTIDLLFDGSQVSSTTTNSSGAFSFTVSSTDLTGGILLTDTVDKGNTYYQTNSPVTVSGVDLWGSTLRVMANTASNTALGTAAGGQTVNYAVSGANLTTNAGINLAILSTTNYTLDGNITAGTTGTLSTSTLSQFTSSLGSVTLTGNAMALGGSLTSAGTVNFNATGTITDSGAVNVGGFVLQNGTWTQIVGQNGLAALPAFSATSNFELQGGSTFERFAGGSGTVVLPYEIADVYGLQGLASPSGSLLGANAELVNDIDAGGTATWNSGAGFVPIGAFAGVFNGQGHTLNGLYINTPNAYYVGLFGQIDSGATVENVGVTNVQISGFMDVGGLVGVNQGGMVNTSYATGAVTGGTNSYHLGGLVGFNEGTVNTSYATVAVTGGTGSYYLGGLVGYNDAGSMVETSYATGEVKAGSQSNYFGGLVGYNDGLVETSYATGAVSDSYNDAADIGGLVGENDTGGTVEMSYATGPVTAATGSLGIGGLVGGNNGTVETSYATGAVSGSTDVSGLLGYNGGTVETSFATGVVSGTTDVGGLVGFNGAGSVTLETCYATGAVSGTTDVGGLVGENQGTVETSYWLQDSGLNTGLSGIGYDYNNSEADNIGATPETRVNMEMQSTFVPAGMGAPTWDFVNTWTTYGDTNTPQLIGLPEVLLPSPGPVLGVGGPGDPTSPIAPVTTTITQIGPISQTGESPVQGNPGNTVTQNTDVVGGADGVASAQDQPSDQDHRRKLANTFGNAKADDLIKIIREDIKDGSTVNTGTEAAKWASNTGLSKIVHVGEYAQVFQGLAVPFAGDPLIFKLFQQQAAASVRNELSQAAWGTKGDGGH